VGSGCHHYFDLDQRQRFEVIRTGTIAVKKILNIPSNASSMVAHWRHTAKLASTMLGKGESSDGTSLADQRGNVGP